MSSNPLQSSSALQGLMKDLDGCADQEQFLKWRSSFVDQLETFLGDPENQTGWVEKNALSAWQARQG